MVVLDHLAGGGEGRYAHAFCCGEMSHGAAGENRTLALSLSRRAGVSREGKACFGRAFCCANHYPRKPNLDALGTLR